MIRAPYQKYCPFSGFEYRHQSPFDWVQHNGSGLRNFPIEATEYLHEFQNTALSFQKTAALSIELRSGEKILTTQHYKGHLFSATSEGRLLHWCFNAKEIAFMGAYQPDRRPQQEFCGMALLHTHVWMVYKDVALVWSLQQESFSSVSPRSGESFIFSPLVIKPTLEGTPRIALTCFDTTTEVPSRIQIYDGTSERVLLEHTEMVSGMISPPIYYAEQERIICINGEWQLLMYSCSDGFTVDLYYASDIPNYNGTPILTAVAVAEDELLLRVAFVDFFVGKTLSLLETRCYISHIEDDLEWTPKIEVEVVDELLDMQLADDTYRPLVFFRTRNATHIFWDRQRVLEADIGAGMRLTPIGAFVSTGGELFLYQNASLVYSLPISSDPAVETSDVLLIGTHIFVITQSHVHMLDLSVAKR